MVGHLHFLPLSATFCRFKPVKTGNWHKVLFAGRNANPVENYYSPDVPLPNEGKSGEDNKHFINHRPPANHPVAHPTQHHLSPPPSLTSNTRCQQSSPIRLQPSAALSSYLFALRHLVVGQQAFHDVASGLVAVLVHAGQMDHLQRATRTRRVPVLLVVLKVQRGGARRQALRTGE